MKKNCQILFFLLIVLSFACNRKNQVNKSIASSEDSLPVYLKLANDINLPLSFKQKYNQKSLDIILNQKNDSVNKINLFKVANRYYNMSDWKAYLKTTKLILERSRITKDSVNMAKSYTYLGDYYVSVSISDSAFLLET